MHAFAMSEMLKSSRAVPDAAQSTSVLERWNALQSESQARAVLLFLTLARRHRVGIRYMPR